MTATDHAIRSLKTLNLQGPGDINPAGNVGKVCGITKKAVNAASCGKDAASVSSYRKATATPTAGSRWMSDEQKRRQWQEQMLKQRLLQQKDHELARELQMKEREIKTMEKEVRLKREDGKRQERSQEEHRQEPRRQKKDRRMPTRSEEVDWKQIRLDEIRLAGMRLRLEEVHRERRWLEEVRWMEEERRRGNNMTEEAERLENLY
ncbi:hypothetical protein HK101_002752, partial [Irineochytrium annulatum]